MWLSRRKAYLEALLITALALVARWLLDPFLGSQLPFVTFFIAVAAVVSYRSTGPAVLAAVAGGLLALFLFMPPRYSFAVQTLVQVVGLLMYVSVTLAIIGFGGAMRRAQVKAREAERRARRHNELLQRTLISIGDGVITTDSGGRITLLNSVAEKLTGWESKEAEGRLLGDVYRVARDDRLLDSEMLLEKLRSQSLGAGAAQSTLLSREGVRRVVSESVGPIADEDGRVVGMVLVFRDITERRMREKSLAESESRKSAMLQSALDGVVSIDDEGTIIEFNPAAEKMFGYGRAEAVGREMAELIVPPRLRDAHRQGLARYLETGKARVLDRLVELTAVDVGGREFPVEVSIHPIELEGDKPSFVGYIRDITNRVQAQQEILRSEERFRALATATATVIWTCNARGEITSEQPSWSRYTGQAFDEYKGRGWLEALHPETAAAVEARWNTLIDEPRKFTSQNRVWHADSQAYRHVESFGVPLLDADGKVREWVGMYKDVEHEWQLEAQLQQSVADLTEANRRKTEFLAVLAHELRNPLAPLRHGLDITGRDDVDADTRATAFSMMERQLEQLIHLVDDLFDMSRIDRGAIELRRSTIDISEVVRHAAEAARSTAAKARQQIEVETPGAPIHVDGDANRLSQVMGNLLSNAIKYSEPGSRIRVQVSEDDGDACILVRDEGVGIDPAKLSDIFDLFVRADPTIERSRGGLGIGLTLVRKIVELHGGKVAANSEGEGRGSEFVVRLPRLPAGEHARKVESISRTGVPAPRKILVVDDNRDAADSLAMLLKLSDHEVYTAYDGLEAVRSVAELRPDVVVLDIGLPQKNGYEVASFVRGQDWGHEVMLIALTGWGQDHDRERAAAAGFDTHFVKPVEFAAVRDYVENEGA